MKTKPYKIARQIRAELETLNQELKPSTWGDNLCGGCLTGSSILYSRLRKRKIRSQIMFANVKARPDCGHAWVETDTHLIDVTYTQFKEHSPKVLFISKTSERFEKYRKEFTEAVPISRKDFYTWANDQNPDFVLTRYQLLKTLKPLRSLIPSAAQCFMFILAASVLFKL